MVNKKFADKYFAGKDPLQQRINVEELIPGVTKLGPYISWQVVGVFNNVRAGGFRDDFPVIAVPFAQIPWPAANIGVHTAGDPSRVFHSIAAAVHSVDPQIALAEPHTLEEIKSRNLGSDRFIMTLLGTFAFIALLLAAVGIYGVISFTVAQREHEIGLRMALGASRANVMNLVLKEALILACIGLGIGLVGAFFIGRGLHSAVYGVGSIDYGAIAVVALVLLSASLVASWIPARRAAGVEPMKALRTE
jgi:predicted lysophospholipase L1 biosynthesis ABC-type transport system permease subunit